MRKISIILSIFLSMFIVGNVKAASARINISPANKTILVGNTITVTVTVSSDEPIAGLLYTLYYDSSILSLQSTTASTGGARNLDAFLNNNTYTASYKYVFKAKQSGTSVLSINDPEVRNSSTTLNVSTGTAKIKVMTQRELEATYSSNNNLSGLSIEGYELTPAFDKNTLEYSVKLKPETESININATKEDGTATINGAGTVSVSEGSNTIKIDVVAQNGNIKSYTINAIVEEYDPINVTVDGENYTVVRSKKVQTFTNSLFNETTVQIGEYEVPAYYNEITKKTVVALKDKDGNLSYFIYDNNKYMKFNELKLNSIDLMLLDTTDIPKGYSKSTVTINDIEYPAYKIDNSRFALVYGVNLANNNEGFYVYDNYENTLQRYDSDIIEMYQNKEKQLTYIVYVLAGSSIALIILLFISLTARGKKKKEVKNTDIKHIEQINNTVEVKEKKIDDVKQLEEIMDSVDPTKELKELENMDKKPKKKTKKK